MDSSANQRLAGLIEELKKSGVVTSDSAFAERTGVGRSYVSEIRRDKRPLTNAYVEQITNAFPQVSPRWLLAGEGEMLVGDAAGSPKSLSEALRRIRKLEAQNTLLLEQTAKLTEIIYRLTSIES